VELAPRRRWFLVPVAIAIVALFGLLAWNQWWRDQFPVGSSHRIALVKGEDHEICVPRPRSFDLGDWHWMDSDRTWPWAGSTSIDGTLTIVSEHEAQFVADDGLKVKFTGGRGRVFSAMPCQVAG
jgi:hypothetical protein